MERMEIVGSESGALTPMSIRSLPDANSEAVRAEPASATSWRQQARQLQKQANVFYFVFKHPRTPWYARLVAAGTAGYLFSPIQLIPSFIPVVGFLDDLLVLFLGAKLLLRITPPDVLTECRQFAKVAELISEDGVRSSVPVVAAVTIATVWLLSGAATWLMTVYISH